MNHTLTKKAIHVPKAWISLRQLTNQMVSNLALKAIDKNTIIDNKIDEDILVNADETTLEHLIYELLTTVVAHSKNGKIALLAEHDQDVITIQLQEKNNYNGYALDFAINGIAPQAFNHCGHISIKDSRKLETNIFFSFPNYHSANFQYSC